MTVSTESNLALFIGNGVAAEFDYAFRVLDAAHLRVDRLDATSGGFVSTYSPGEYTVAGVGSDAGSITLLAGPLPAVYHLRVTRIVPYVQGVDIVNQGGFYPEVVETQLDLTTMGLQQLGEKISRALLVPEGETSPVLPSAATRARQYLAFNDAGDAVAVAGTNTSAIDAEAAAASALVAQGHKEGAQAAQAGAEGAQAAAITAQGLAQTAATDAQAAANLSADYGDMPVYRTWALLNAAPAAANDMAIILTDTGTHTDPVVGGTVSNSGIFSYSASPAGWERIANTSAADAAGWAEGTLPGGAGTKSAKEWSEVSEDAASNVANLLAPKKNYFNKLTMIRAGKRYSNGSSAIVTDASGRCTTHIPVTPGQVWAISGSQANFTGGFFPTSGDTGATGFGFAGSGITQRTVTVPSGAAFMVVNLCDNDTLNLAYDDTLQIELGATATAYEAYTLQVNPAKINDGISADQVTELDGAFIQSKNLFDKSRVRAEKRYSPGSDQVVTDATSRCTHFIAVTPGLSYTISGGESGFTGGWFATESDTGTATDMGFATSTQGTFVCPAGRFFLVVNLCNGTNTTAYDATLQVEVGSEATFYVPYGKMLDPKKVGSGLQISQIDGLGDFTTTFNDEAWLKYVGGEPQPAYLDKWPVFRKKWYEKYTDLTVLCCGTSLTARTTEHHSAHPNASARPPLMHSLNVASYIWDKMVWDGQFYARYDAASSGSEPSGTWATASNLAEWDDATYREGLTRYSASSGGSFIRNVPSGAWAWRLIYRTDSIAPPVVTVAISGGNNQMQVYDEGTSAWVEANGYTFSQREAAASTRSVSIPNPDTDAFASSTIATKGNTTYQKRLKFRCKWTGVDTRATAKTVTFTNTSGGRLDYWGHEWSKREVMVTFINAARGSHNTQATSSLGLPRFADNEVHSFKPDLIYTELPIHNDGASNAAAYATWDRWGRLTNNYIFRSDYELSLLIRAAHFGYTPEIGMWTPTIAYGFGGIDSSGQLIFGDQTDGVPMTALDKFDQAAAWVAENKPDAVFVNAVHRWVDAGFAIYGDLKTATQASSKTGPSMTNDGDHPNDIGSKILAKVITASFAWAN